ncbi:MAG TPA: hypothetical protein VLX44_02540 [Xanthobacteraceae bacterium]|nr:hypothetical protein [Xanthobacteraceae bacterium]
MAELDELEHRLSVLRGDLSVMSREGCTPTQFLKLQRDLVSAWAAVEEYKSWHMPMRSSAAGGDIAARTRDEASAQDAGRNRG